MIHLTGYKYWGRPYFETPGAYIHFLVFTLLYHIQLDIYHLNQMLGSEMIKMHYMHIHSEVTDHQKDEIYLQ